MTDIIYDICCPKVKGNQDKNDEVDIFLETFILIII